MIDEWNTVSTASTHVARLVCMWCAIHSSPWRSKASRNLRDDDDEEEEDEYGDDDDSNDWSGDDKWGDDFSSDDENEWDNKNDGDVDG